MFGLVPMATYLTVRPEAHPMGFVDAAPHRASLSPVYNQYLSEEGEGDDAALVLRPLFTHLGPARSGVGRVGPPRRAEPWC